MDVKSKSVPKSAPPSPYVVLPSAAVQQLTCDDYATPPSSPTQSVPDDATSKVDSKSVGSAAAPPCQSVSTGGEAVDNKCVTSSASSGRLRKPIGLPLKFLEQFSDCVLTAPIADADKRRFFVSLIEGAQLAVNDRLQAGQFALHGRADAASASVALSEPSSSARHRRDRHGGQYSLINSDWFYVNNNGQTANYVSNGAFGFRANGAAVGVQSLSMSLLNAPFIGDAWGSIDPGAVAVRLNQIKMELTLYPRNAPLTFAPPPDTGTTSWDPLNVSKLDCRIIILRDKWGCLANGVTVTSNIASTATNVTTTSGPPTDYTSLFTTSVDPSVASNIGTGASGLPSINRMHFNILTQAMRYEILHDEIVDVAHMQAYAPQVAAQRQAWIGLKRVAINLKLDNVSLIQQPAITNTNAIPQTNAIYMILIGNMNTATLAAIDPDGHTVASWLPQVGYDIDYLCEFQSVIPITAAP